MEPVYISLGVLGGILIGVFLTVLIATKRWPQDRKTQLPPLRGLLLPKGSVRAMLAFLIVGAFIIFAFLGERALDPNEAHFESILTAFGTLSGAVTGFYFGARGAEQPPSGETASAPAPGPGGPPGDP